MFRGFTDEQFAVFRIEGLQPRMKGIRESIQPGFHAIWEHIRADVEKMCGREMYLHVAKHLRRTVNPPKDTWMAVCHNKRGYKQHPHFQIGLYDDRVFIWLAYIYEVADKTKIAERLLSNFQQVREAIPEYYHISIDHMKKSSFPVDELTDGQIEEFLHRFRNVKSAELLIGREIPAGDPLLADGPAFIEVVRNTLQTLMPLYRLSLMQSPLPA